MAFGSEFKGMKGMIYECVRCGHRFDGKKLAERGAIKCPECSFKVIRKTRPPIVKRVKAI